LGLNGQSVTLLYLGSYQLEENLPKASRRIIVLG